MLFDFQGKKAVKNHRTIQAEPSPEKRKTENAFSPKMNCFFKSLRFDEKCRRMKNRRNSFKKDKDCRNGKDDKTNLIGTGTKTII